MDHPNCLLIDPSDNVLIARVPIPAGGLLRWAESTESTESAQLRTVESIAQGHKIARTQIAASEPIIKYGQSIGRACAPIAAGRWVHLHNVRVSPEAEERSFQFATEVDRWQPLADWMSQPGEFLGYSRPDGQVGTRNDIAVISSVNCSASVSKLIARHFTAEHLARFPHVDGVIALTHPGGCAMAADGQQHRLLNRVLGGMARHPNVGGYLLVGLGCEKGSIDHLVRDQQLVQIEGIPSSNGATGPIVLTMQNLGGTARTVAAGIERIEQMLPEVDRARRTPQSAATLLLATQCGGSDGNSGITANPAVGVACDALVAQGGTAILGETTEIVGAEHLLTRRAISREVGEKLLERIAWWKWYAGIFGETFDDNRSAGNAAGGLTTIAEKSLGAIAKAGSSPLVDVYQYGERIDKRGLVIMDSPGYDPCSLTGMIAGGANLIAFTTGRGSCYGCKPVPSIKIATNTPMFDRMEADMDLNAGTILDGDESVTQVGQRIVQLILRVASGEKTKSEQQNLGDEEFVPWMIGPVL